MSDAYATPSALKCVLCLFESGNKILETEPDPNVILIALYKGRIGQFEGSNAAVRHSFLYSKVASDMANFQIITTGAKCQTKMNELRDEFKGEFDKARQSGSKPSEWPYYMQMFDLLKGTPTLEACFAQSVGTSNQYRWLRKTVPPGLAHLLKNLPAARTRRGRPKGYQNH